MIAKTFRFAFCSNNLFEVIWQSLFEVLRKLLHYFSLFEEGNVQGTQVTQPMHPKGHFCLRHYETENFSPQLGWKFPLLIAASH